MFRQFRNFAGRGPVVRPLPEEAPTRCVGQRRRDHWVPGTFLVDPNWFEETWYSNRAKKRGLTALAAGWLRVARQGVASVVAHSWQRRDRWGLANQR
ncbi:MAG: hypothetical protein JO122_11990 [Acetobacteraceae bacterium]|nr:hypothetical protein [Acetobacteraceae bacterium]